MKKIFCALVFLVLLTTAVNAAIELTGEQFIIVGETAPATDVLTGVTIGQFLKGAGTELPVGSALIDTDAILAFSQQDLAERIFYVIDGKTITILIGTNARSKLETTALLVKNFMQNEGYSVKLNYNPFREDLLVTGELPVEEEVTEENDPVVCTMDAKQCPDGSYVGRIAPDCLFAPCPEYVAPESEPEVIACQGCARDERCIPYGSRLEGQRYCALDGVISAQQDDEMSCLKNYECKSNQCSNGLCQSLEKDVRETKGLIQSIFGWFAKIFG